MIHRDLKPDNIMIVPDPDAAQGERAKILDFGIAKLADGTQGKGMEVKTRTGAMMGTPVYMSPEQCLGTGTVDDRSDVYAVGIMMYEMLAGKPPFNSDGLGELVVKHIMEAPRPLRELVPGLNPRLESLVHAMLAKAPTERPAMTEVAAEVTMLGPSLAGAPIPAGSLPALGASYPTGPGVIPVPHPSTLGQAAGQRPSWLVTGTQAAGGGRTRALLISAVAGVLLVGLVAALIPKRGAELKKPPAGVPATAGMPMIATPPAPNSNRQSYPDGTTIITGKFDPAHVDLTAFFQVALDEARARIPDVEPTTFLSQCVQPDGIANLGLCGGSIVYVFRSPAKSVRGNTPIGVPLGCLVQVILQPTVGMIVRVGTSERCEEKVMNLPRCQPKEVWDRARKAGAPDNAIGQLMLVEGKWHVQVDGKTHSFPDNC